MLQLHYFVENLINIAIKIDEYKYVKTSIDEMIYKHTIYINPSHVIKITPSSIRRGGGGGGGIYCKISVSEKSNDFFAKIEAEDAHALFFDES